jgi:hypothetical protein
MRRPPRVLLTIVLSLVVVAVAILGFLRFVVFRNACDHFETVLSKDAQGRSVIYVFEACTTIGTVTEAWVDLTSPNGHRIHLLDFAPWGGELTHDGSPVKEPFEPVATWESPTKLRISIGTVGKIMKRQTEADGVHVTYDIGLELYK